MSGDHIEWIETATAATYDIDRYVDRATAIKIAREEPLGINAPERRVDDFLDTLPTLFDWFGTSYRPYPWRARRDRWAVLVAEILLQRTRADAVADLYDGFLTTYPDPAAIVEGSRETLRDAVDPLGFGNKRTETLTAAAGAIVTEYEGEVPDDLETLQTLPRIGPYTARACLCFADGRSYALVDTNIAAVVTRVFGYENDRRPHKDRALYEFMDALIPDHPELARLFNLSLLDLRPLICGDPPDCPDCPLQAGCLFAADQ